MTVAALSLFAGACAQAPAVPEGADAALTQGRDVWSARCATCHGPDGGGGTGPRLNNGQVLENFPDAEDQTTVVVQGRNNMPSFSSVLSDEEILAVVRYSREVLN